MLKKSPWKMFLYLAHRVAKEKTTVSADVPQQRELLLPSVPPGTAAGRAGQSGPAAGLHWRGRVQMLPQPRARGLH